MPLTSRNVLITGASSGIGLAMADEFSRCGATVFPTGRRASTRLDRYVPADLTRSSDRDAVGRAIERATDHLDVAIYNAGLLGTPRVPLAEYDETTWRSVLEVNVTAIHLLHQRLDGLLSASNRPTVIVVSSSVGRTGRAGWGAYAVTKHAIEGWAQVLADEWGKVGRVYSVNPGGTATPMRAAAFPSEDPAALPSARAIGPVFLHLAHENCIEPTGSRLDARDWIGRDPWNGLQMS